MRGKSTSFFKVWEIVDKDGVAEVKLSTSRKIKENSYDSNLTEKGIAKKGYVSTYWSFVKFVGKAYNQLNKYNVESGTSITNLDFSIEQEPYYDSTTGSVAYPKNIKFTVFEFELANSEETSEETTTQPTTTKAPKNIDKAPKVEEPSEVEEEDEDDEEGMPF